VPARVGSGARVVCGDISQTAPGSTCRDISLSTFSFRGSGLSLTWRAFDAASARGASALVELW
jgi:hypothetical protein